MSEERNEIRKEEKREWKREQREGKKKREKRSKGTKTRAMKGEMSTNSTIDSSSSLCALFTFLQFVRPTECN